ncbi:MAG: PKD domain-containing protein, partial [Bacteroidia bacterium]
MKNCFIKNFTFTGGTNEVKKRLSLFLIFVLFSLSVYSQSPVANFTASTIQGCAPLQVSFTNNSTNAVSFQWTFGDGNSSTILNPSNIFMSPGNYEIKLIAQNSTGQIDSFMVTIIVNPKPAASFSVSSTSACVNNNQFTFTNTSSGADSYLWDFGDGNVSTNYAPSHTYNLPGSYSIKLITNNNFGCTHITEKINHITIHPKPDSDFTLNKNYACDTTHSFLFTPIQSNLNYLWNFGDGNTSTLNSPTHNYSAPGVYNISLITENNFGCKDTVVKNGFAQVGSTIPAIVSANQTSGCPPLNVTMSTSTPGMVMTYYDFGTGLQISSSHIYNTSGNYNVTVTQIDDKGCAHITTLNNYFTVYPSPQVSFTTIDTSGCSPYDVQLTNTTTNAVTYNWDFDDGSPMSTALNPLHTYYNDGAYNITLEAVSSNGCVGSYTYSTQILVQSPIADISSNIKNGCAPLTVNFYNQSTNGVQFFWDFGDGTSSTVANPTKTYLNAGNYSVTLGIMSSNGCVDTIIYNNYIQVLNPYSAYNAPTAKSGCAPFTVSFTDNTSGNSSVVWDFGDGTTSNATSPVKTYTTPGIYTISLTVQTINGCTFHIPNYQTIEVLGAKAHFSVNYTSCPPYIATFTDSSVNAVSWLWNFGDSSTSTQQNPIHTYGGYGTYNVSLTITTAHGCSHTQMVVNAVVFEPLSANFTWTSTSAGYPMTVNFMANSTGATNWLWDFGDGGTSTLANPIYTYQVAGQYSVTLTVSNNNCSITYTMSPTSFGSGAGGMDPGPGPGPEPVSIAGCAPFTAQFNDPTLNSTDWLWIFGDGNTSTLQNPTHTYYNPGIYDITLITSKTSPGGDIQDTITMKNIIVSGPIAAFNVITNTNCQSTVAQITDQSINAIQWNWNFGDGNTSTQQNPTHTYQSMLNNYSISLTATDSIGCTNQTFQNINSGTSQIISASKYSLCKGDTVYFTTNLSGYSFYIWDFGDGNISFNQQASHIYNNHGNYQVSLIVYSNSGCTFTHYLPVNVSVNGPVAAFSTSSTTFGCDSLEIKFENLSNNYTGSEWIFGNGVTSSINEPSQTYGPGIYDVTLIVSSNGCLDSITEINFVTVSQAIANFTYTQNDICLPSTVV